MKLIIAIVQDDDAGDLIDVLNDGKFGVTKLATTGGFLKAGNTTLIIGVNKEDVDKVLAIIEQGIQDKRSTNYITITSCRGNWCICAI